MKLFIAFFGTGYFPAKLYEMSFFLLGEVIPKKISTEITVRIFLPMPKVYCYLFQMYWIVLM